tara:strand:+ start:12575 stop:14230 length:1656 start_codon:yes stop_codon:yes gene_type:complete
MAGDNKKVRGPLADLPDDDLERKKSEFSNLNTQFGQLNSLFDSGFSDIPFNQREKVGFFQLSKKQLESSYAADIFANSGPYIGVVLRIESNEVALEASENNWLIRSQLGNNPDPPPLLSIRVRIPELHAALPIPITFKSESAGTASGVSGQLPNVSSGGNKSAEEVDKRIIDMYPIFSSADTKTSSYLPEIGSLVWVDFVDKKTQSAGVYLRPVNADKTTINSEAGAGKSSQPFNSKAQGSTGASAATGGASGQVATSNNTNSPTLQKEGFNFYSSKGGFIIPPRTTLGGMVSKYDNKENLKVTNDGTYKTDTRIRYLKNIRIADPGEPNMMRTNRVRPYSYGNIEKLSRNLVDVPTSNGIKRQKLHILAAERFEALNIAWFEYISGEEGKSFYLGNLIDGIFKISRGFESHKYNNDYDYYVDKMMQDGKYGSIKEAQRYEPFRSVYETGLVFDIGNNGFQGGPSAINSFAWGWLIENAYLYGIYPSAVDYKRWEVQLPRKSWFSGKEFANTKTGSVVGGKYYKYCTYVIEESKKTGRLTSDERYEKQVFE